MGEGPDANGHWFGDAPDDAPAARAFWWRVKFRELISAAQPSLEGEVGEMVKLLARRNGEEFDGEIHLSSFEGVRIAALLTSLSADNARLREELDAQIAGNRLTAKQSTETLIRANTATAALQEGAQ
ncbi:hypothetical protein JP75_07760 [Devosia riboflavina]|uniref:Uncharacterized protein n=2 Tax=Devosia riboflavina TaxID=46914 RepID=A0A087M3I8_9HYPH|nr:hypothetical protein JP75_07760 [Devosia riboflavina]